MNDNKVTPDFKKFDLNKKEETTALDHTTETKYPCNHCGTEVNSIQWLKFGFCEKCWDDKHKEVTPDLEKPDFERLYITKCAQVTASEVYDKYVEPLQKELSELHTLYRKLNEYNDITCADLEKELLELKAENTHLKEKEIRGDRMIVDLEHDKTALKSELEKAKELLKDAVMCFASDDWEVKILKQRIESFLKDK